MATNRQIASWRELSNIIGIVLMFSIVVYNLWNGSAIIGSIFRGVVVYLVFSIVMLFVTNILVKILSDYEYDRMRQLAEQEELEEEQEMMGEVPEEYEE